MILLLLGTNPYPFNRLLDAVDEWAASNQQKVIAQTGHTPIEGMTIECHDFVGHSQVIEWIKQADFVISQGGFGSIKDCIQQQKAVLVAPRLQEYNECQDSQKELVDALVEEGRVVPLFDVKKLPEAIMAVKEFAPPKGVASKIPGLVENIINDVMNERDL